MRWLIFVLVLFLMPASPTYARDLSETIRFGGVQRFYHVHVPQGFDGKHRLPVVIVFHSFTNDGLSMVELSGFNQIADREKFLVVYPEGIGRRWYFGEGGYKVDDVGFTLALSELMRSKFFADPKRTYAVGISNGGFLVLTLACQHPERFAAVATVAATFTQQQAKTCKPTHPVPITLIHGEADPLVPFRGGRTAEGLLLLSVQETVKHWAVLDGCENKPQVQQLANQVQDGTNVLQTNYLKCQKRAQVRLYRIAGGGHTWPGSKKNLPSIVVGKTSQNLNASEALWQFFHQFP
jgi:polyhydroxybutyrate depolymerase